MIIPGETWDFSATVAAGLYLIDSTEQPSPRETPALGRGSQSQRFQPQLAIECVEPKRNPMFINFS
jgi:hypothetical protein